MRFRERTAEDREVLAEDEDEAAVDHPVTGHDAVAGNLVLVHAEVVAAMFDEHVPLFEGAFVEQQFKPFAGGELAFAVLRGDALFSAALPRLLSFLVELGNDVVHVVSSSLF